MQDFHMAINFFPPENVLYAQIIWDYLIFEFIKSKTVY